MIRFALLLASIAASAPAWAGAPLSRTGDGRLTAPVQIAGAAPTPFVIDTGAAGCSVSNAFASARHLLSVGPDAVLAPGVKVDGQEIGTLRCALRADGGVDGVIGADALQRFVVRFDTRAMTLSLHGGAQHGQALVSPRAQLVDAQRLPDARIGVPVRFNSADGVAVVGTGSPRSAFNARFARAAGGDGHELAAGAVRGAFSLAGAETLSVDGRIAALPVFAATGLRDQPAMVLGLDRLQGLSLVIDYPRGRIWFDPG